MIRLVFVALLFAFALAAAPAWAVRPDEMLADPRLEARAEQVGSELRCLVCRNQSVEDSDADLAHDIRVLVRERIAAGDSDAQVVAYIHSRYGDFVLLRPPFKLGTAEPITRFERGNLAIGGAGGLGSVGDCRHRSGSLSVLGWNHHVRSRCAPIGESKEASTRPLVQ